MLVFSQENCKKGGGFRLQWDQQIPPHPANFKLRVDELYLIALAINADPGEMFKELFAGLGLRKE